jgi:hypothetical protein
MKRLVRFNHHKRKVKLVLIGDKAKEVIKEVVMGK